MEMLTKKHSAVMQESATQKFKDLNEGKPTYEKAYDYGDRLPEGVDPEIYSLTRAIADSQIVGHYRDMNNIQSALCGFFISCMVTRFSIKNKQYKEVMVAMRQLVRFSTENKKVVTRTNFATYDFKRIFEIASKVGMRIGNRADCMKGTVGMYELSGFPTDFKKEVIYPLLNSVHPETANLMKRDKLKMYITEDFNIAVENRFWLNDELTENLGKLRAFDRYKITPNTTLYVLDPE